jgi:enoyl-CoA hydratase
MPDAIELQRDESVGVVRLNRPERRNALSPAVLHELAQAIGDLDADEGVRCIVVTGTDEVFAAGADIKAMAERSFQEVLEASTMPFWQRVADCRTPLVAGVSGFALGGGCELALLCDLIVASETAEFGQPEITLGIIPGGGGTQRLARVIGKYRTMELVLTGRRLDARKGCGSGS